MPLCPVFPWVLGTELGPLAYTANTTTSSLFSSQVTTTDPFLFLPPEHLLTLSGETWIFQGWVFRRGDGK